MLWQCAPQAGAVTGRILQGISGFSADSQSVGESDCSFAGDFVNHPRCKHDIYVHQRHPQRHPPDEPGERHHVQLGILRNSLLGPPRTPQIWSACMHGHCDKVAGLMSRKSAAYISCWVSATSA